MPTKKPADAKYKKGKICERCGNKCDHVIETADYSQGGYTGRPICVVPNGETIEVFFHSSINAPEEVYTPNE